MGMEAKVFWLAGPWKGRLGIVPRPRGAEWLDDETRAWREAGIDIVVSLLEPEEEAEIALAGESASTGGQRPRISLLSYPRSRCSELSRGSRAAGRPNHRCPARRQERRAPLPPGRWPICDRRGRCSHLRRPECGDCNQDYSAIAGTRGARDTRTAAVDFGLFSMACQQTCRPTPACSRRRSAPQLIPSVRRLQGADDAHQFVAV